MVPGGVGALPLPGPASVLAAVSALDKAATTDVSALMGTASFLDRLRRTGPFSRGAPASMARSGRWARDRDYRDDAREFRPYDAYPSLGLRQPAPRSAGDALARLLVRWDEVRQSFHLLRQVADELAEAPAGPLRAGCEVAEGRAVGWAEAPQGEVLYDLWLEHGRITRCRPRSASFHNLVLMHELFTGDILTDFPFIEASLGLSVAGVAR